MNLHVAQPTLQDLDAVESDALVLHHFVEDRPLKGLAGLADWRLNGWLSRIMLRGLASGELEETTLMPANDRLGVQRILLVGLGRRADYSPDRFRRVSLYTLNVLLRMRVRSFATSLPGIDGLEVGVRQTVDTFLTALHQVFVTPDDAEADLDVRLVVPRELRNEVHEPLRSFAMEYRRR